MDEGNPIIFVPVDQVVLGERQREPDPVAIERMRQSMADVGLLHPLGITPQRQLIFGATRLAAARLLGWDAIEAREFASATDPEVRALMEWEENEARDDLTLEQQLAYKRRVVDPILKARAQARQRAGAVATNVKRWGDTSEVVASGNFPQATPSVPVVGEKGEARDLVGQYLEVSGRTMEKFEALVDWSEDPAVSPALRDAAMDARARANVLGKVDGEYKRVRALKEQLALPEPSTAEADAVLEQTFVRGYGRFEELLEKHDPAAMARVLTPVSWKGLGHVLQQARDWWAAVERAKSQESS